MSPFGATRRPARVAPDPYLLPASRGVTQRLDDGAVGQHISGHVDLLSGFAKQNDVDPFEGLAGAQ
jgi:hypothetical protein